MVKDMTSSFNLERYLSKGIDALVRDIMRATFRNPTASAFFLKYARAAKRAENRRSQAEKKGEHIPSFLIASITGQCNLRCAGCYDRAHQRYGEQAELHRDDWRRIFAEAEDLGISVILLAGGEPLMRPDVIEEASLHPTILFPIFTNGTMLNDASLQLFAAHRNLIPIVSVEGDQAQTDARRGEGIFARTVQAMERLGALDLLFGASITVTSENLASVTHPNTLSNLRTMGCKAAVFVEYVPVERPELALDDTMRNTLERSVRSLREREEMIIISFPGDEKESGGCLAAGRGFFHINATGGAEPCPFSPYSDTSLRTTSLRDALQSPLFTRLRADGVLDAEHTGGCTLFSQVEYVSGLVSGNAGFLNPPEE